MVGLGFKGGLAYSSSESFAMGGELNTPLTWSTLPMTLMIKSKVI